MQGKSDKELFQAILPGDFSCAEPRQFINPDWGLKKLVNTGSILTPANLDQLKPQANTLRVFQMATSGGKLVERTFRTDYNTNSTYLIQFGIGYMSE